MAQFPALPLFTDAYMADTRHLNASQHGAYLLLLMTAWRMPDCRLPNDDKFLARCASTDLRVWKSSTKDAVMSFWKLDGQGKWYQDRLLQERKYVSDKSSKNAAAGKASALKRLNRDSTNVQPNVNVNPTPTPTPTPIEDSLRSSSTPVSPKKSNRVSLEELSTDHIAEWLTKKRIEGKYLRHDPQEVLDYFKDYCRAKGKKYADYTAAYRNAFEWERFSRNSSGATQDSNRGKGVQPGKSELARKALLESARQAGLLDDEGIERARETGLLREGETA